MDCTPKELKERFDKGDNAFLLVDVRTHEELDIAALPQATHIPIDELESRMDELVEWEDKEIVLMCHHGMRSAMAQEFLLSTGFSNVRNLEGGIDAYSHQVDPNIPRY